MAAHPITTPSNPRREPATPLLWEEAVWFPNFDRNSSTVWLPIYSRCGGSNVTWCMILTKVHYQISMWTAHTRLPTPVAYRFRNGYDAQLLALFLGGLQYSGWWYEKIWLHGLAWWHSPFVPLGGQDMDMYGGQRMRLCCMKGSM